jgi:hypothetical protein
LTLFVQCPVEIVEVKDLNTGLWVIPSENSVVLLIVIRVQRMLFHAYRRF